MKQILILMLGSFLFFSCNPQDAQISFNSPDGNTEVHISGSRSFKLDPWKVSIGAAAFGRDQVSITVDLSIEAISDEFISWDWQSPEICLITFKRPDETNRYFKLTANKDITHLVEVYL